MSGPSVLQIDNAVPGSEMDAEISKIAAAGNGTGRAGWKLGDSLKVLGLKAADPVSRHAGVVHNASLDRQCIADALGNRCVDLGFVDGSVPGTVPQTDTPVRDIGAARKPEAEVDQVFTKIGSPVDVIGVVTD